jgi:ELWxxDGT repeat protein
LDRPEPKPLTASNEPVCTPKLASAHTHEPFIYSEENLVMSSPSQVQERAGASRRRLNGIRRHRDSPPRFDTLESRTLLSLTPQMVGDLNTLGAGSNPQNFTAVGATTYFVANDGVHGAELWKTNGAASGTSLVKDINPGPADSGIFGMTNLNGTLLFFANDGIHGNELWKSNGTLAGTTLVDDINPGAANSNSYNLAAAVLGSKLYFAADDGTHGKELWVTDGTTAGTTMVADIDPGSDDSGPSQFASFNGKLYFEANDGAHGYELWQSNGTAAGTSLLDDINSGTTSAYPTFLTVSGKSLYFVANDATGDRDLWKTDGTLAGTEIVSTTQESQRLTDVNGTLYFESEFSLWKTDGTASGTTLVSTESDPRYMTGLNGKVYFSAYDGTYGRELFVTDGTPAGTTLVKDINPGGGGSYPTIGYSPGLGQLAVLSGKLYFAADDGTNGEQLWRTDGTSSGTAIVDNINPGSVTANGLRADVTDIAAVNGRLFFQADDGSHGTELWTSLGKAAGTSLVKDIDLNDAGSNPTQFTASGGNTYFRANDSVHGVELWKTDGTSGGTSIVADINPGNGGSYPSSLIDFNGKLVFAAGDGVHSLEMWQSDGTAAGTAPLLELSPNNLTLFNGKLIFGANDNINGDEPWVSDGTVQGTSLLKDINPAQGYSYYGYYYPYPQGSYPSQFTAVGAALYFAASGPEGNELWKTDGTSSGTVLVADINPGSTTDYYGDVTQYSSSPRDLTAFNGLLFFVANDGIHGRELWESDGTAAGTEMVADIYPGTRNSIISDLTVVGNQLFFEAYDGVDGVELWKTDGTTAGTVMVKDINPGAAGSDAAYAATLINLNGSLLFTATDGTHGVELWRSDGTATGTVMVKDINPGDAGSFSSLYAATFATADGLLFFAANDGTHGRELWQSDGTTAGTKLVMDINPGLGNAFPAGGQVITNVNGSLYFAADDGVHGIEPWVIPASQFASPSVSIRSAAMAKSSGTLITAAAATAAALISNSADSAPLRQVFGEGALIAPLPVPAPLIARAQAKHGGPVGPSASFVRGIGARHVRWHSRGEGHFDSFPVDRKLVDRPVLAG